MIEIINMLIFKVTFKSWSQKLQLLIHTGLVLLSSFSRHVLHQNFTIGL